MTPLGSLLGLEPGATEDGFCTASVLWKGWDHNRGSNPFCVRRNRVCCQKIAFR